MAIAIVKSDGGTLGPITSTGLYVFKVTGADTTKPIIWSGDDTFDLKVGDWTPTADGKHDPVKINKPDYISMHIPADHYDTRDFALMCTAWPAGNGPYEEARAVGHFRIGVSPSKVDPKMSAGKPTVYVVHERDEPQVTDIETPFDTTFSETDGYQHDIIYSGDSSFYWDHGQVIHHKGETPTDGKVKQTMTVADWAPHADYTGYTTVSATCVVTNRNDSEEVVYAQDGYEIFMEYMHGALFKVRLLKADEDNLLFDAHGNAIETHGGL